MSRRILVVGDALVPSGFARVIRSIFGRLADRHELHQLAIGYSGDPVQHPWPLYPAGADGDPLGINRLARIVDRVKPDAAFVLHESGAVQRIAETLRTSMDASRIVAYLPINAAPVAEELAASLAGVRVVAATPFGSAALAAAARAAGIDDFVEPPVIPHGVDTTVFRRLDSRRDACAKLGIPAGDDTFIVLNANANRPWKGIDATIRGFAEFAAGKPPGVRLYLHMGLKDQGWDVVELVERYGVLDRCLFSTRGPAPPIVSDEMLNLIYNACDIGINTAACEGVGLVSLEHGATGAAQIVPRHTGAADIWFGHSESLEPAAAAVDPVSHEQRYYFAPADVAAAIERLYSDAPRRAAMSDLAYARATSEEFDWDAIAGRWQDVFAGLPTA